jgi:hypothetical protein
LATFQIDPIDIASHYLGQAFTVFFRGEQLMGTTFVNIGDRGFWVENSLLELWFRFLALHIEDPVESACLVTEIRDRLLTASCGYLIDRAPAALEEAVSTPAGEELIRSAIDRMTSALSTAPDRLSNGVLNLMWFTGGNLTKDIDTWRLMEIGQAYLDLLDGKIETEWSDKSFMPGCRMSLTRSILPVIALVKGSPLSLEESDRIEAIVSDHSYWQEASPFLLAWFQLVGDGKVLDELFFIPRDYPEGASGLVNILADINKDIVSLDIDEQGESFSWRIPASGLRFIMIRETNIDGDYGAIRPLYKDLNSSNSWFSAEYERLRQGGNLKHLA